MSEIKLNVDELEYIFNSLIQKKERFEDLLNKATLPADKQVLEMSISEVTTVTAKVQVMLNKTKRDSKKLYYFKDMDDTVVDCAVCYSYEQAEKIRERLEESKREAIYIDEEA